MNTTLRGLIAEVKVKVPASLRPENGCARSYGADGEPDAEPLLRGSGADQSRIQAHQTRRRRSAQSLWWQGATLLNPHFAVSTKDQEGSQIFYEPLAAGIPVESSWQISLPRSQAAKTAASLPTACL